MPIDSAEKRASAMAHITPARIVGVIPNTIDQAERQAAAWVYSGIAAAAPPAGGTPYYYQWRRRAA
jgi:hypothetical protein